MTGRGPDVVGERTDEGSTLPLILVFLLVAAGLVVVAAGATALHLERLRLLAVADGAALAAAESFPLADARVEDDAVVPRLEPGEVRDAVDGYLADADPGRFDDLTVVQATTSDHRDAVVVLRSTWRPPIAGDLLPMSFPVVVRSQARALFR